MKLITLCSPDGKSTIDCHPERKEYLMENGWTEKKAIKLKPAKAEIKKED